MSKEVEEELFLPCSDFHFTSCGSVIRVSAQDVERNTSQDAKILRAVILAGSGT